MYDDARCKFDSKSRGSLYNLFWLWRVKCIKEEKKGMKSKGIECFMRNLSDCNVLTVRSQNDEKYRRLHRLYIVYMFDKSRDRIQISIGIAMSMNTREMCM